MKCPGCGESLREIAPPEWDSSQGEMWPWFHCEHCDSDWSECGNCEGFGYFGDPPEDYYRCEECDGSGLVFEE